VTVVAMAAVRQTILLTGFEGYGGRSTNPSADIVRALDGVRFAGYRVHGYVLPVCFEGLAERLSELIDVLDPRLVLSLGLSPGEPTLRLEQIGVNMADFEIADNTGRQLRDTPVMVDGPTAYRSTLPLGTILDRLLEAGIPARLSSSAGLFLCNAVLYLGLHCCAARRPVPPCGFIHLPYRPEQVAELLDRRRRGATVEQQPRADLASMAFDDMLRGVRLALETVLTTD
jgi:pyroglutamyl-peptidase